MRTISADIIIIIVFASILLAFIAFMLVKSFLQGTRFGRKLKWRGRKNGRGDLEKEASPFDGSN
jgi:hypothetical protein